ncbi:MAG: peptide chain release factor 1 [Oscillospiraceae bacterium]|nr:peptide chain release factor 1 [Oscillospiraceae bacterium]
MPSQLQAVKDRYEEMNVALQMPETVTDATRYRDLMREYKNLTPIVEKYDEYRQTEQDFEEAKELLEQGGLEPDFKEMVQEEYERHKQRLALLEEELQILLLPKDENDERSVIMEIRAGTGGEEAALFGYNIYRMYTMYAEKRGWKTELLSVNETELGGFKEAEFSIEGEGVYSRLKFESGAHRVQRVPDTESQGRIQTSAVTVAVMPEAQEVEIELNPNDLKIDTFRSSGAGGQHINKTSSAIRVTHLPTGMVVECQDERSQYKNKDKALMVLRSRLYDQKLRQQNEQLAEKRRGMVGSGDRSERIRTYNYPQGRITDHRINLTLYKLDSILDGDLDELLDALITAEQAEKLKEAAL